MHWIELGLEWITDWQKTVQGGVSGTATSYAALRTSILEMSCLRIQFLAALLLPGIMFLGLLRSTKKS